MKYIWTNAALMPLAFALGCSDLSQKSTTKEAPDSSNALSHFEITSMPTYDEILATKEVFTKNIPWSDTYWPYTEKGMARRWGKISANSGVANISQFWQDQLDSTKDRSVNPLLSPAEKYDLIYRLRYNKSADSNQIQKEIKNLAAKEQAYRSASNRDAKRSAIGMLQDEFAGSTSIQSWSPMASQGWDTWLGYTKNPNYKFFDEDDSGDDWSWMGICHGWSPAALMHNAPRHAVMVKIENKDVLLTEGDIRGLLSKSWADHAPRADQYFLGRRCNENVAEVEGDIPHDDDGRGVTGYFIRNGKSESFTMIDEFMPGAAFSGRRIYEISLKNQTETIYLIEKTQGARASYYLSRNLDAVRSFVEAGTTSGLETLSGAKFYGCWDVNPASLHTIITEHLGKEGTSFVMDRTRTGQVWNQPVYGARMEVGALLEAASTDDALFRHRAPGTVYLAQVKTSIFWAGEPSQPSMAYAADFDRKHIQRSDYEYTLEFDADKRLIGGEWGTFEANKPNAVVPDFLYGFRAGSLPDDDLSKGFDYTGIINPIYLCSLSNEAQKSIKVGDKTIKYVDCDVSKAY